MGGNRRVGDQATETPKAEGPHPHRASRGARGASGPDQSSGTLQRGNQKGAFSQPHPHPEPGCSEALEASSLLTGSPAWPVGPGGPSAPCVWGEGGETPLLNWGRGGGWQTRPREVASPIWAAPSRGPQGQTEVTHPPTSNPSSPTPNRTS